MAYATGTITGFTNFIDTLKTFLTTNSWVSLRDNGTPRELLFRNSDTDVVIGFKVSTDNLQYYNLILNVAESFNSTATFFGQPGSVKHNPDNSINTNDVAPVLSLYDNSINYWFFLNNRRLIVVARCGTSYNSAYLGKILPYGSPNQYPKPHFCGGNANSITMQNGDTSATNLNFMFQLSKVMTASVIKNENRVYKKINSNVGFGRIYPFNQALTGLGNNKDGSKRLYPAVVYTDISAAGELDGIYAISGIGSSPEQVTTDNEYIIFNNVFRTGNGDFFAIKIN